MAHPGGRDHVRKHHSSSSHHSSREDRRRRSGSRDRDRRRDRSRERDPNVRPHRGGDDRYRGGGSGYGGGHRGGGYRGRGGRGGGRGRGRGRGGGSRGGAKFETTSLHSSLLRSIQKLSLHEKGTVPLKVWIDKQTQSEFEEARFKQGFVTQTRENGKPLDPTRLVEEKKIPHSAECKEEKNSEKWWGGLPRKVSALELTFKKVERDVYTNSIRIDDASLTVHQYTFEIFAASQPAEDASEETKRVALELPADRKRDIFFAPKVRRAMKALNPVNFDNLHIFSFAQEPPSKAVMSIEYKEKEEKYEIVLKRQYSTNPELACLSGKPAEIKKKTSPSAQKKKRKKSFNELYKECSLQFQEQGLNILNRTRFYNATYTRLDKRDDIYYSLRDLHKAEEWRQRGCDLEYPDLRILTGYKSSITYANHCITKTRTSYKVICKHSVHDFVRKYGVKRFNSFLSDFRRKNVKIRAITNYSHQIVVMDELDERKNLDSRLDETDASSPTFREYYSNRKNDLEPDRNATVKLLEKHEDALVMSHHMNRDGSIKDTIYFLPQLLFMIVPKEMQDDAICAELRKRAHAGIQTMVNAALDINKRVDKMTKAKRPVFSTEKKVITVKGYYLHPPSFCYKTQDGVEKIAANTDGHGRHWKRVNGFWRSLSAVYGTKKEDKENVAIEWAICYDRTSPNRDRFAEKLLEMFYQFNERRTWSKHNEPARKPSMIGMDYADLHGIREKLRSSRLDVAVFIIPNTEEGGKLKADISRFVLFRHEPTAAFTRSLSSSSSSSKAKEKKGKDNQDRLAMDLQFICEGTIDSNKAGKFNVFENIFTKSGLILYYLEPKLPSNKFNYKRLWMIGIKILRKKLTHVVCISCLRAPFVGSVKYLSNHTIPLESRRDVIPQKVMHQATMQLLEKAIIDGVLRSNGDEQLPFNIVILRSSVSDGQFKSLISHELAGFRRALSDFVKERKTEIKKINKEEKTSKWYPGLIFSVLQENVTDAFGVMDNRNARLQELEQAMVVNAQITSNQVFDVFMSLPTTQERVRYGRVLRLVTLQDEYNAEGAVDKRAKREDRLRKSAALMSDYVALLYSSLWAYALNIPYPKTPNLPAPLSYADHYAQWQYRALNPNDTELDQLHIDCENAKPKLCHIELAKDVNENDVDVEMEMKSQ